MSDVSRFIGKPKLKKNKTQGFKVKLQGLLNRKDKYKTRTRQDLDRNKAEIRKE